MAAVRLKTRQLLLRCFLLVSFYWILAGADYQSPTSSPTKLPTPPTYHPTRAPTNPTVKPSTLAPITVAPLAPTVACQRVFTARFTLKRSGDNESILGDGLVIYDWTNSVLAFLYSSQPYREIYQFNSVQGVGDVIGQSVYRISVSCPCARYQNNWAFPTYWNVSGLDAASPIGTPDANGCQNYTVPTSSNNWMQYYGLSVNGSLCYFGNQGRLFELSEFHYCVNHSTADTTPPGNCTCTITQDIVFSLDRSSSILTKDTYIYRQFLQQYADSQFFDPSFPINSTQMGIVQWGTVSNPTTGLFPVGRYGSTSFTMNESFLEETISKIGCVGNPCNFCNGNPDSSACVYPISFKTCTGCGLYGAGALFLENSYQPRNSSKVIVLITDGNSNVLNGTGGNLCCGNGDPASGSLIPGVTPNCDDGNWNAYPPLGCYYDIDQVKQQVASMVPDVSIFAIGIGLAVNLETLQVIASSKYNVLASPNWTTFSTQLENIVSLTCVEPDPLMNACVQFSIEPPTPAPTTSSSEPTAFPTSESSFCNSTSISFPLRHDRPAPLLANQHDLVEDFLWTLATELNGTAYLQLFLNTSYDSILAAPLKPDFAALLNSTYDDVWRNVMLDVNLLFEEALQYILENHTEFDQVSETAVNLIHNVSDSPSVLGMLSILLNSSCPHRFRSARLHWILPLLNDSCLFESLPFDLWEDKLSRFTSSADWKNLRAKYDDDKFMYYSVKLVEMIITQYPDYGGSIAYMFNEDQNLAFWEYHVTTLWKGPDRILLNSSIPNPKLDSRTYSAGLLPLHNQRNLALPIQEVKFCELPKKIREKILLVLNERRMGDQNRLELYQLGRSCKFIELLRMIRMIPRNESISEDLVTSFWDVMDIDAKKELYQNILHLPWSTVHIEDGNADPNVVGVLSNVMFTPDYAGNTLYAKLLDTKAPFYDYYNLSFIPPGNFWQDNAPLDVNMTKIELVNQFVEMHQNWYDRAFLYCLPVVGGTSGHALGYLNIYQSALNSTNDSVSNFPSMELLRGALMGGLIGTQRHHSYTEVMSASVGIPDAVTGRNLSYDPSKFYVDMIESTEPLIRDAAQQALVLHNESLCCPPRLSTLRHICLNWNYDEVLPLLQSYISNELNISQVLTGLRNLTMAPFPVNEVPGVLTFKYDSTDPQHMRGFLRIPFQNGTRFCCEWSNEFNASIRETQCD